MSVTTSPPPITEPPLGAKVVTKNSFFTYIEADKNTKPHRAAIQVWNVTLLGWSVTLFTGGSYTFTDEITKVTKTQTNNFHKKHLVTLNSGGANPTLENKGKKIWDSRTTAWQSTKETRNKVRTQVMNSFKQHDKAGGNASATKWYGDAGYGNKLISSETLTVIDCSMFAGWEDLAAFFAGAFKPAFEGTANKMDEFVTGGTWHPYVDFGVNCIYEVKNGLLQTAKVYQKCQIAAHLIKVGANQLEAHIYHLANATD